MKRRAVLAAFAAVLTLSAAGGAMAADKKTIAGIVFQQDQFFRTIQTGMEAAAKDAGVDLLMANSESKPEKEASLVDTYIARGVSAIVISPISAKASIPALKRAADAGIKIVTYNSGIDADLAVSYLNSSQLDLGQTTGKAAAEFVKAKLGGKAKIATLGFKALLPEVSGQRVGGFLDEVKKGGDVQVVSQQDAWLAEKAVAVASDIIRQSRRQHHLRRQRGRHGWRRAGGPQGRQAGFDLCLRHRWHRPARRLSARRRQCAAVGDGAAALRHGFGRGQDGGRRHRRQARREDGRCSGSRAQPQRSGCRQGISQRAEEEPVGSMSAVGNITGTSPVPGVGSLAFSGLTKAYGSTVVLDRFTHVFAPGRVHALMGKNGSGKSTLVKVLSGAVQPSAGTIHLDGAQLAFASPADAMAAGIATVHQELSVIPSLSIGENIYLGRLPTKRRFGVAVVDWEKLHAGAAALLHDMGLDLDPRQPASALSVGQQQVIEIVKAMSFNPKILLLDEPTSALASREVEQLFALVRRLRARGVTMVYITHRMSELFEIADECVVLRDGALIGAIEMADATPQKIVNMMFGDVANTKRPARVPIDRTVRPVLEVRNLTSANRFSEISFDLYPGEILGFAGLLGSGRTEILRAVFGADRADGGTVAVDGKVVDGATPRRMKAHGLGFTPENRKEVALVQILSTHDNLCMANLAGIAPRGIISRAMEAPFVRRQIDGLGIKAEPMLPVASLSGGNQQKVVIGNWLNTGPKIMLFDEPSRGVDVHARRQIFDIIWAQAKTGLSSIFVSTELEELLEVTDRILVLRHGRIVAEVTPEHTTLAELYALCMKDGAQEGLAA